MNNWGTEPLTVTRDQQVGTIESGVIVPQVDPVWEDTSDMQVRLCETSSTDLETRKTELQMQLQIGEQLSNQEKTSLEELLLAYSDVFALTDEELGETDLVTHSINTGDAKPVKTLPRRLPYALHQELEEEMRKLIDLGCIEASNSPYASALVLVRKKGGGLHVCVDYRSANKDTVPDCFPMPRIDELVEMVGRTKPRVFSSLDLMRGYHQVRMAEDSKHKMAFTCHLGLYQYRRMPFGLTNAPATFQRLMFQLFSGSEWTFVFVYLDDILVASSSVEEHVLHVRKVLQQIREAGLRLKPEKCNFATQKIEYLGHTLIPEGVKPNETNIIAVKEFPRPQSVKEVRTFLGLVNFYRKHVKNMAIICRPLTALTRKDRQQFTWSPECEEAFAKVKQLLVSAPLLHPPNLEKDFFLWTDASEQGFGAVLEQEDENGIRHPVAYASRPTNSAEMKYAPTELEVAALVYSLEHFQVYLLGNRVTVYTDHQALVSSFIPYLKSQTKGLLARWYLRLSPFLPNINLQHKPGTVNQAADALSRAPVRREQVLHIEVEAFGSMMQKVRDNQREDPELSQLMDYLEQNILPDETVLAKRVATQAQKGYYIVDSVLYYEDSSVSGRQRLVVPTLLRKQLLLDNHDAIFVGHFAPKKMLQRVSQYYYWPKMSADVHEVCRSCVVCLSTQGQDRRPRPPLKSIPVGEPFECVGMDFKEFDVSNKGNRYALVFQDYLTKWPEVFPVADRTAKTVASCLAELVWRHGVPARIIHDRAAEFLSDVLQDTAAILGVKQLPTSGGHPQTDGLVERLNRTLKSMLSKLVVKKGRNWDELLGPVLMAYKTTPQASSGESPFYLLYGRDASLPSSLDFYVPKPKAVTLESDYGRELFKELKQVRSLAKQSIAKAQNVQKQQYDKEVKNQYWRIGNVESRP